MSQYQRKRSLFRDSWKEYFTLSGRVRRGLLVLFGLMFIEIVVLLYLHYKPTSAAKPDVDKFKKEIDAFYASPPPDSSGMKGEMNIADRGKSAPEVFTKPKTPPELFHFNPNKLPESEWKRLGFSDRQIRSIKNYESKGGRFTRKEDVKKMYAIHEDEFNRIAPYIDIPVIPKDTAQPKKNFKKEFLIVDIGTADSTELDRLPMVGEYLAKKIYTYREKLGGFYSVSQLKEVYGMRDSALQVILPHIVLKDSDNLRRIDINAADFETLNSHPYIDRTLANLIVSYRKTHGAYKSKEDLQKVVLVDGELYRKIAPYIKVE